MQRFREWLKEPEVQCRIHKALKFFWLALGVFSLTPWGAPMRGSLAVIFFVSVYANYVSHWSAERAIDSQLETRSNE